MGAPNTVIILNSFIVDDGLHAQVSHNVLFAVNMFCDVISGDIHKIRIQTVVLIFIVMHSIIQLYSYAKPLVMIIR